MLEKNVDSVTNEKNNIEQIRVDDSIESGLRLSQFDSRYRLGSVRASASQSQVGAL